MKLFATVILLSFMFATNPACADAGKLSAPNNSKWKEECGSCHIPYPPQMLTADTWQHLMSGLDRHFGADAALDAQDAKLILDFLERNAGSGDRYRAASMRITDTQWFKHEHHVISDKEWANPEVRSRANCAACHGKVVLGD